jgi:hypothetical protein
MPTKSIAVPETVYDRVQAVASAEGTTVERLTTQALERDLARRCWIVSAVRVTSGAATWPTPKSKPSSSGPFKRPAPVREAGRR